MSCSKTEHIEATQIGSHFKLSFLLLFYEREDNEIFYSASIVIFIKYARIRSISPKIPPFGFPTKSLPSDYDRSRSICGEISTFCVCGHKNIFPGQGSIPRRGKLFSETFYDVQRLFCQSRMSFVYFNGCIVSLLILLDCLGEINE